jgi:hypothetical protein
MCVSLGLSRLFEGSEGGRGGGKIGSLLLERGEMVVIKVKIIVKRKRNGKDI